MEDPATEISHVIHLLTQSAPSVQRRTIETYFTASASFTHPFCRTGSFDGSRWLIWCVYRWYKIMSPRVEMRVDSVAYDEKTLKLYVTLHQVFRVFLIPYYRAHVTLTTVLQLVPARPYAIKSQKQTYLIQSQNDLYQVNEFVKFASQFGVLSLLVLGWQFVATGLCVLGSFVGGPVTWAEERVVGGNGERKLKDVVDG